MNFFKLCIAVIIVLIGNLFSSTNSFALDALSSTASAAKNQRFTRKENNQKINAAKEIARRIETLNKLILRIQEMKKLSDTDKTLLINQAKEQIASLELLQAKINSDTDPAILKADRQMIAKQYRIYMLFIPRIQILASADRIIEITDDISLFITKIQDRLIKDTDNGKNVASLQSILSGLQNKLANAKAQAEEAKSLVGALAPDNGDANIAKSNQKALQSARAKLVSAKKELEGVKKDIQTIRRSLPAEKSKTSTSSASPAALRR